MNIRTYFDLLDNASIFELLLRLSYTSLQNLLEAYPKLKIITVNNTYFDENWKKHNIKVEKGEFQTGWAEWCKYTAEIDITNGLKHGLYTIYDCDTHHVRKTKHYIQDKRHGVETTYNDKNVVVYQVNWSNDKKQGVAHIYDRYGNLKQTLPYVLDLKEGISRFYKENKRCLIEYRKDKPHGKVISWFENGQRAAEETYRNGVTHGRVVEWYRTGIKYSVNIFNEGQEKGVVFLNNDGTPDVN